MDPSGSHCLFVVFSGCKLFSMILSGSHWF